MRRDSLVEMIYFNLHVRISIVIVSVVITSFRYLKNIVLKSLSNLDRPFYLQVLCGLVFPRYCVVVLNFRLVE